MSMKITGYTNVFKNKWKATFGVDPEVEELNDYLSYKSARIQKYIPNTKLVTNGSENVLASYWIPEKNIIIKVDPSSRSAVVLHTKEDLVKRTEDLENA